MFITLGQIPELQGISCIIICHQQKDTFYWLPAETSFPQHCLQEGYVSSSAVFCRKEEFAMQFKQIQELQGFP